MTDPYNLTEDALEIAIELLNNPEEYQHIRDWFNNRGNDAEAANLTMAAGADNAAIPRLTFRDVKDQRLGHTRRGDSYETVATILHVISENMVYKACPTEKCNKEIIDLGDGVYVCKKCTSVVNNFKSGIMANVFVEDWSGSQWITLYNSELEKILEISAQSVMELAAICPEALAAVADKCKFRQFVFKCNINTETYNGQKHLKTSCFKVEDYRME